MQLYHLLKDRSSINILKILYDKEFVEKKKHTLSYSELKPLLDIPETPVTLQNLEDAGLINKESNGTDLVMSITQKGKEFIDQFEKLRLVINGDKKEQKAYQVQYSLTPLEQRILLFSSKMKSETGMAVPLLTLTQEVYPYREPRQMTSSISKYAKRLESLNLIKRTKVGNKIMLETTESGERAIKDQSSQSVMTSSS